jgi:hypothetical protein
VTPSWWAAGVAAALVLVGGVDAGASHLGDGKRHRIVYQLDDAGINKARFVLNNVQNHVNGVRGWKNVEAFELVVFGPALRSFVTKDIDPAIKRALEAPQTQGLTFGVCGNTMKGLNVALEQLPDGAKALAQGGVVRVMELQEQGYAYIRP